MRPSVLVVEDDHRTAELIRRYLDRDGYPVVVCHDGRSGIEQTRRREFGVVILDLLLPVMGGLDVCRVLRAETDTPIIVVTARVEEDDVLLALDLGADDYVTKPFRPRELVARVRAVLRRNGTQEPAPELLRFGCLEVDARRRQVRVGGALVPVTRKEFALLWALASDPGRVFTRTELLDAGFGIHYEGLQRTIDAHVRNLRRKLEPDPERPTYIQTVYGVGYTLAEHPDAG